MSINDHIHSVLQHAVLMTSLSARAQARRGQELRAEHAAFILINGPLADINVKKQARNAQKKASCRNRIELLIANVITA